MEYLNTKKLAKIHNKSQSFMNMILCRPEFGQYRKDNEDGYFKFINDVNLHRQIRFIINRKENIYGKTCRCVH